MTKWFRDSNGNQCKCCRLHDHSDTITSTDSRDNPSLRRQALSLRNAFSVFSSRLLYSFEWKIQLHQNRDYEFSRDFHTLTFLQFSVTKWFDYLSYWKKCFPINYTIRDAKWIAKWTKERKNWTKLSASRKKRKLRRQREKSQNTSRSTEPICDTKREAELGIWRKAHRKASSESRFSFDWRWLVNSNCCSQLSSCKLFRFRLTVVIVNIGATTSARSSFTPWSVGKLLWLSGENCGTIHEWKVDD